MKSSRPWAVRVPPQLNADREAMEHTGRSPLADRVEPGKQDHESACLDARVDLQLPEESEWSAKSGSLYSSGPSLDSPGSVQMPLRHTEDKQASQWFDDFCTSWLLSAISYSSCGMHAGIAGELGQCRSESPALRALRRPLVKMTNCVAASYRGTEVSAQAEGTVCRE